MRSLYGNKLLSKQKWAIAAIFYLTKGKTCIFLHVWIVSQTVYKSIKHNIKETDS